LASANRAFDTRVASPIRSSQYGSLSTDRAPGAESEFEMSARLRPVAVAAALVCAWAVVKLSPVDAQSPAPGGFLETATSTAVRPLLTAAQLQSLLPARGPFNFPAPYSTKAVRLSAAADCAGGTDCVWAIAENRWQYMNNSAGSNLMYIAVAFDPARGGLGPSVIRYNKVTGETVNLGPMFALADNRANDDMAGWYFSGTQPTKFYIATSGQLQRFDILTHVTTVVIDATNTFGVPARVWSPQSSDDDKVHTWMVYPTTGADFLGCGVLREDTGAVTLYQPNGHLAACQVDRTGAWLLMKEDPYGNGALDNRIINLASGAQTTLLAGQGAARMLSIGFGVMVGDDFSNALPGAYRTFTFGVGPGPVVYREPDFDFSSRSMSEISFGGAQPGALDNQFACGAAVNRTNSPRANEIVCARLDGSLDTLVVAPVMTDLDAPGGAFDDRKQPHGIVDPTGRYFLWYSNARSNRLDAFLVSLPIQVLVDQPDPLGPEISEVAAKNVTGNSAVISWKTEQPADGVVQYGLTNLYGQSTSINPSMTTTHTQWLTGLQPGKTYHYRVTSTNSQGVSRTSGDFTFTTAGGPRISDVSVSSITPTDAVVRWKTNQPATSVVDYGPTSAYGSSARMPGNPTNHAVVLRGLTPGTEYHFRVRSQNRSGVTSTSPDATFKTLVRPVRFFWVAVKHIKGNSATIVWTTDEKTRGRIEYGTTTNYDKATDLSHAFTGPHLETLRGLARNTVYHYRIVAVDRDGGQTFSRDFVFKTARR